jgi:hypothetical protein
VLSGELDTVTSPIEGRATAALFPRSVWIETPNLIHESAIGDGGVFVPPNGQDLSECIGPIVRGFMESGGTLGDLACLARIRPIRTVPAFARRASEVTPALPGPGNEVNRAGLALASAVAETIGDVVARYYVTTSGQGSGLRGGSFILQPTEDGYVIAMKEMAWTDDLRVSGRIDWNQMSGEIEATAEFTTADQRGSVRVTWNDRETEALAHLSGEIERMKLVAVRTAP